MKKNSSLIATFFGLTAAVAAIVLLIWKFSISEHGEFAMLDFLIQVCGILVSSAVFIVSALFIFSLRAKKETFESTLDEELEVWSRRNHPLISVENDYEGDGDTDGATYAMLVDHDNILRRAEDLSDAEREIYFTLPNSFRNGDQMIFYMSEKMFQRRAKAMNENVSHVIEKIERDTANAISSEFPEIVKAHGYPRDGRNKITVSFVRDMKTPADAREVIKLVDYVTTLYLATA